MVNRYSSRLAMQKGSVGNPQARQNTTPDCGCNMGGECKILLKKLQKVDFSLYDTILYLDMYPECQKALAYYNKLLEKKKELCKALAEKCGSPMTAFDNSGSAWNWTSAPWPWEYGAN